tara:strand:+ start:48677 stop:49300 length:624 start_codon:yes stop_codon:yes gene_type:complete
MKNHELANCPVCGEGQLSQKSGAETFKYKGQSAEIPVLFAACNVCGVDQACSEHLRANKRAVLAFHKEVDGLLTGSQVRDLRRVLKLSQSAAAQVFGGGPVAFSKYENDDVSQSEPMDKLMRVAMAVPQTFAWLAEYAGLSLAVTRMDEREVAKLMLVYDGGWAAASNRSRPAIATRFTQQYTTAFAERRMQVKDESSSTLLVGVCS